MIYALTIFTLLYAIYAIAQKRKAYLLLLVTMLIISMGNFFNADYSTYERMYNNIEYSRLEPGYSLLMSLGKSLGLSYNFFVAIIILLGFLLILRSFHSIKTINYILVAYLFYPFLLDVTQLRFFLSVAIFIYFTKYLLNTDRASTIKYILGILISASIHVTGLFYLVFLVLKMKNYSLKKLIQLIIIILAVSSVLIIIVNNNQIPFILRILESLNKEIYYVYFETKVNLGFFIPIFYYLTSIYLLKKSALILRKNENLQEAKFADLVLGMHIVSVILFPLFLISLQFVRFYRSLALLKYAVFSITDSKLRKKTKSRYVYNFQVIIFIIINFIFEILLQDRFMRVFLPIFENNIFF